MVGSLFTIAADGHIMVSFPVTSLLADVFKNFTQKRTSSPEEAREGGYQDREKPRYFERGLKGDGGLKDFLDHRPAVVIIVSFTV